MMTQIHRREETFWPPAQPSARLSVQIADYSLLLFDGRLQSYDFASHINHSLR